MEQQNMDSGLFSTVCRILQIEKPANDFRSKIIWWLVKTIWLIVILFFATLTIQMSCNLLSNYLQQPSVSNLNVMYNKTFQLPKTTFCLPLFVFEFDQNSHATTTPTYYQDEIEIFFSQSNVTKQAFLNSYDSWPNSVFSVTLTYVTVLYGAEVYAPTTAPIGSSPATNYYWFNPDYFDLRYIAEFYGDSWEAAIRLETKFEALNVSIYEAKIALGRALQDKMKLNVMYNNGTYTMQEINDLEVTTIDSSWVCYVIDWGSRGIVFKSSNEYVEMSMDGSLLPFKSIISGYVSLVIVFF
jgi:hypothetical protein